MSMTEDQNTIANNAQTESIVKKILTSEVKYVIGIIIFLAGVVAPYYSIKTEIALIKQNHLAHIETMQRDILNLAADVAETKKEETELMKMIIVHDTETKTLFKNSEK